MHINVLVQLTVGFKPVSDNQRWENCSCGIKVFSGKPTEGSLVLLCNSNVLELPSPGGGRIIPAGGTFSDDSDMPFTALSCAVFASYSWSVISFVSSEDCLSSRSSSAFGFHWTPGLNSEGVGDRRGAAMTPHFAETGSTVTGAPIGAIEVLLVSAAGFVPLHDLSISALAAETLVSFVSIEMDWAHLSSFDCCGAGLGFAAKAEGIKDGSLGTVPGADERIGA